MKNSENNLPVKHNPYLHDLIWDMLKDRKPGLLLDLPSGPGYFAQQAQQHGFQSIAGEIDEELFVFKYVDYCKIDMSETFPLENESTDYIVCIEGIEHIENQFFFIRECGRILKKKRRNISYDAKHCNAY